MFDRMAQAASRPAGGLPGTNCSKGADNPDDDGDGDGADDEHNVNDDDDDDGDRQRR